MEPQPKPKKESPLVLRSVLCGLIGLGFAVSLTPIGFAGWMGEMDPQMVYPRPGAKISLTIFYLVLIPLLVWCARLKSTRVFSFSVAVLAIVFLLNLSGCFIMLVRR
jgi:hypothetical protein